MAQYTQAQRIRIRTLIGYGYQLDFEPRITSAIEGSQAFVDGGSQPDDSLQQAILAIAEGPGQGSTVYIDNQLSLLSNFTFASQSASGSKVRMHSADRLLRKQGNALIHQIVIMLGLTKYVRSTYYGGTVESDDPTGYNSIFNSITEN
jgi:hypothetical protein